MSGRLFLLGSLALAGCLPDTRLSDERRPEARPGIATDPEPGPDIRGPTLSAAELTPLADCLRLRITSDEPATLTATFRAGDDAEERPLGSGATLFDMAVRFERLPPGGEAQATFLAQDAEGNPSLPTDPVAFQVPPPRSPLTITELLINPMGSESTQEYVEIRNLGNEPVSLAGASLQDDGGSDPLPATILGPGAVALVVGMSFDAGSPEDTPPAPDALLLRVPGRIGRDGLRQSGEVVQLVDGEGRVLSSYGGWVDASRPGWQGRSVQRTPDPAACDHPRSWSDSPQPPTPGR